MKTRRSFFWGLLAVLLLGWISTVLFAIDETEIAVVTRFGRPLPKVAQPGLNVKMPWPIDDVERLDSRLLLFDNEPIEMLTADKKNLLIDSFICWHIADPLRYTQTVRTRDEAEARLLDISVSELGAAIGSEPMDSFLDVTGKSVKFADISRRVTEAMNQITSAGFGIEVLDFQINGFNFPDQNRSSVISRMRAERSRIATRYRSEGEESALVIKAEATTERERILARARSMADSIRGAGEAEALRILGEAYAEDPEFYRFLRTLESYKKIIDEETTIFIESDSKLMKVLTGE
ncbi:MAG: protease modulator HflC [Candidatus Eisenbacteria bacterium]|uniref:Protein HflC n=1 Tax=Eiseniibacteriota bacterium TaxID=2212470 RepID=A0A948RY68_UNCEI|nr:protease modulator HflC [Candidatus Eisenbacteria bacterium]MBU1950338.1 protease modulator HflC [Candidatus Eisenbacteria bacterium]MBU2693198.1 protease modulator HflC [Candidatus Eisenbacteria bacterium]